MCGDSLMVEQNLFQDLDSGSIPTSPLQLKFRPINYKTAINMITKYHYLHRKTPISWAFGAYFDNRLLGVLTIGKPASHTLLEGVAGPERAKRVFELNRLWLSDCLPKNSESRFIGWVIRQLPKGIILVSYADIKHGHIGIVYQSTNWIYTGQSIPFVDYTKEGLDHRSIPKSERIKENLIKVKRSRKNRYVYFTDKKDKIFLRWANLPYPKY